MASEGISSPPVRKNALQTDGRTFSDGDLASRKAKEASLRRYEAGGWLRKMVGVVAGKDLPAHPSEDEFRLGLRSGIILCRVLNKVKPNSVSKVVAAPGDSILIPDGEALSACQYFENVKNFLASVKEMGLPTFEISDLEKGGKSTRIVNCVLSLKSFKEDGGNVLGQVGESWKPTSSPKQFAGRIADLFTSSVLRSSLSREKSVDSLASEEYVSGDAGLGSFGSLSTIVQELLVDKEQEDIPVIVENILSEVMEELEHRFALQKEQMAQLLTLEKELRVKGTSHDMEASEHVKPSMDAVMVKSDMVNEPISTDGESTSKSLNYEKDIQNTQLKCQSERQKMLAERHQRRLQELKIVLDAAKTDMHTLKTAYEEEVSTLGKHLNGLADAASGYKKVLEENRKLYNLVQDLKGTIRVYCRVRPFLPGQADGVNCVDRLDNESITVIAPSKYDKDGRKSFTFNKVFGPSATQEEVFADTQPLVRSVLDGFNVCIFAYGQTGSGKTHTMAGPNDLTTETMGVNYRALNDLFLISEQRKDRTAYEISVQMIEIYNEQVRDLLVTDGTNQRLEIRNNSANGINVPDASIVPVSSPSDVIKLMDLGHKNRAVGSTAMNDRSSRSHSCLTVHVQGRDLESGTILRGCMHLVDLAGSERNDKTEAVGDRLKEAQHINKSLSALGDVIASLAQKNAHVPYRNSKLTQLLQDSLGGHAKTLMFVHISPEPDAIGETLSTLKFAERVSSVELGAAKSNKESSELRELKEQNASLKAALARKDAEMGCSPYSSSPERVNRRKSSVSPSTSHSSLKSSDALSERRQSISGPESTHRQPIGGSESFRRQSIGGPESIHRQSVAGSESFRRQSIGGSESTHTQSIGGSESTHTQSIGGSKSIENKSNSDDKIESSLDLQDMSSWPPIMDQLPTIISKSRDNFPGTWANEKVMSPKIFKPKNTPNLSKKYPAKPPSKVLDHPDGFEVATSNSVAPTRLRRSSTIPNGPGSKLKKNPANQANNQDTRSSIPAHPERRVATNKTNIRSMKSASFDERKKTSSSK